MAQVWRRREEKVERDDLVKGVEWRDGGGREKIA